MKLYFNNAELNVDIVNPIYINDMLEIHQMFVNDNWGNCEQLGEGRNSIVYAYQDYAIKVFKKGCYQNVDFDNLKALQDINMFPTLYYGVKDDSTPKYIVMEKINGISFYENESPLYQNWSKDLEKVLNNVLAKNFIPDDIHLRNIMIENGKLRIIDVGSYYHWNFNKLNDFAFYVIENVISNFTDYYESIIEERSLAL